LKQLALDIERLVFFLTDETQTHGSQLAEMC